MDLSNLTKFVIASNKNNYESKVLLVESLIAVKKWSEARNQIKDLLDLQPKKEVCILMSKIQFFRSFRIISAYLDNIRDM